MTEERGSSRILFSISRNCEFLGTYLGASEAAIAAETLTQIKAEPEIDLVSRLSNLAIGESLDVGYKVIVTRVKPVVFPGGKISRHE